MRCLRKSFQHRLDAPGGNGHHGARSDALRVYKDGKLWLKTKGKEAIEDVHAAIEAVLLKDSTIIIIYSN